MWVHQSAVIHHHKELTCHKEFTKILGFEDYCRIAEISFSVDIKRFVLIFSQEDKTLIHDCLKNIAQIKALQSKQQLAAKIQK